MTWTLVLLSLFLAGLADALQLSTSRPRGIKSPTTLKPRTTPKYLRDFEDGKMDEDDSDPITPPLPTVEQKAPTKPPKTPKTRATAAPEPDSNTAIYKLLDSRGSACILWKVDALLAFKFKTVHEEETEKDVFVPNNAAVAGDCGSGDDATLILSWQDFSMTTYFTKTPGGERWYVEKIDLFVNTDNSKVFEHIKSPGRKLHLGTGGKNAQLFPTPVGKSFSCAEEMTVDLGAGDVRAQLLLRDMQVQPFIFRKGEFGPEFVCSPGGASFRDETAPIAVGSTLAIVVLCTVTGYGAFRYFKIKKVQYDTME